MERGIISSESVAKAFGEENAVGTVMRRVGKGGKVPKGGRGSAFSGWELMMGSAPNQNYDGAQ